LRNYPEITIKKTSDTRKSNRLKHEYHGLATKLTPVVAEIRTATSLYLASA